MTNLDPAPNIDHILRQAFIDTFIMMPTSKQYKISASEAQIEMFPLSSGTKRLVATTGPYFLDFQSWEREMREADAE